MSYHHSPNNTINKNNIYKISNFINNKFPNLCKYITILVVNKTLLTETRIGHGLGVTI